MIPIQPVTSVVPGLLRAAVPNLTHTGPTVRRAMSTTSPAANVLSRVQQWFSGPKNQGFPASSRFLEVTPCPQRQGRENGNQPYSASARNTCNMPGVNAAEVARLAVEEWVASQAQISGTSIPSRHGDELSVCGDGILPVHAFEVALDRRSVEELGSDATEPVTAYVTFERLLNPATVDSKNTGLSGQNKQQKHPWGIVSHVNMVGEPGMLASARLLHMLDPVPSKPIQGTVMHSTFPSVQATAETFRFYRVPERPLEEKKPPMFGNYLAGQIAASAGASFNLPFSVMDGGPVSAAGVIAEQGFNRLSADFADKKPHVAPLFESPNLRGMSGFFRPMWPTQIVVAARLIAPRTVLKGTEASAEGDVTIHPVHLEHESAVRGLARQGFDVEVQAYQSSTPSAPLTYEHAFDLAGSVRLTFGPAV